MKKNIAIIGAGVSGITAAYLLQRNNNVTIYEKNDYVGGHTNTITIDRGADSGTPVDTGFIVCNDRTYPNFFKLLNHLNVKLEKTDMSFSYFDPQENFHFCSQGINGLFSQRKNIFKLSHWGFIKDIIKFGKVTHKKFISGQLKDITLGEYLLKGKFSSRVINQFVIPMAAAIWSASDSTMKKFPMENFARFYINHGLLNILDHPQWYFVKGGSQTYVKSFLETFQGRVVKNNRAISVKRYDKKVLIKTEDGEKHDYDYVIIATHADEALNLLADPTDEESTLLSPWEYSKNRTILHSDERLLPPLKSSLASWNYIRNNNSDENPITVTYYMNRLQNLKTEKKYCVTLNPTEEIPEDKIIKEIIYHHPIYTFKSMETQKNLFRLNGVKRTYFCGSYFGYGFHEDGVKSAVEVGKLFGENL